MRADGNHNLRSTEIIGGDARSRTQRLISAVRRLFGGGGVPNQPSEAELQRELYNRIGAFLFENQLEPSPANYELAHTYMGGENRRLIDAVDRAIAQDGRLTEEMAELILTESRSELTAEKLGNLVDEAQAGLKGIAALLKQSGADAQAYGDALETSAAVLEDESAPRESLSALLDLTRSMINKTRAAEQQLRQTGKRMSALRTNLAEARRAAESDPLTGLANRRALEVRLSRAVEHARNSAEPLSLVFFDIDHFKVINDTHGHDVGDRVLRFIAARLAATSGNNFYVARYGGDEFVMLLENVDADETYMIVDKCRQELAERRLFEKQSGDPIGQISFSAGVAQWRPGEAARDLLHNADRALYRGKREGRDQVRIGER